jgi:hypothetical protein
MKVGGPTRLLKKVRSTKLPLMLYVAWLFVLSWMIPPYGDPATHLYGTSRNFLKLGVPLDPISGAVRAPIFYGLLALTSLLGIHFLVPPLLLTLLFMLVEKIHSNNGIPLSRFTLLFPPLYVVGSRTYLESLVALGFALLYMILLDEGRWKPKQHVLLWLTVGLLTFTKEISLTIAFFFLLMIAVDGPSRKYVSGLVSSLLFTLAFYCYVYVIAKGYMFSAFNLISTMSIQKLLRGFFFTFSPIIPEEFTVSDLPAYIPVASALPAELQLWATQGIRATIILTSLLIFLPFGVGAAQVALAKERGQPTRLAKGVLIYSLILWFALIYSLGSVDAFRYIPMMFPLVGLFGTRGLKLIEGKAPKLSILVKAALLLGLTLWSVRSIRLRLSTM